MIFCTARNFHLRTFTRITTCKVCSFLRFRSRPFLRLCANIAVYFPLIMTHGGIKGLRSLLRGWKAFTSRNYFTTECEEDLSRSDRRLPDKCITHSDGKITLSASKIKRELRNTRLFLYASLK